MKPVIVVGGGIAGATAVRVLVEREAKAPLFLISEETIPPYLRPRLFKYLKGEITRDHLSVFPENWYRDHGVSLLLGTKVLAIDLKKKRVVWKEGSLDGFSRLVLASGAVPKIPPLKGIGRPEMFSWRTVADADQILEKIDSRPEAVIIGGGILGIETAWALTHRGCRVTILHNSEILMDRQLDRTASDLVCQVLKNAGISVALKIVATRIQKGGIETQKGRRFPAGMVIPATGIKSRTELAEKAGLRVQNGVIIDERCRTSHPDVWACGDVTQYQGRTYGIIPAAIAQARVAAANLLEEGSEKYGGTIPANTLKVAEIPLTSMGIFSPEKINAKDWRVITRLDPDRRIYLKAVLIGDRVIGTIMLGTDSGSQEITGFISGGRSVPDESIETIFERAINFSPSTRRAEPWPVNG